MPSDDRQESVKPKRATQECDPPGIAGRVGYPRSGCALSRRRKLHSAFNPRRQFGAFPQASKNSKIGARRTLAWASDPKLHFTLNHYTRKPIPVHQTTCDGERVGGASDYIIIGHDRDTNGSGWPYVYGSRRRKRRNKSEGLPQWLDGKGIVRHARRSARPERSFGQCVEEGFVVGRNPWGISVAGQAR